VDVERVVRALKKVAEKHPDVKLLYLFGSYAEGRAAPASDVDLAIVAARLGAIPHFVADVAKELGVAEEKISVLDLESAPPSLVATVLKRGIKVIDRGGEEEKLLRKVEPDALEVGELSEVHFAKWLEGSALDPRVVERIVAQVKEDVEDLRSYLSKGMEAVASDRTLRKAFERTLQTAVEGCVDLLRHVVSGLGLGVAEYYRDYVEICRAKGVVSSEVAEKLLELVPVRHALVHRYREVDYAKLWRAAQAVVEVAPRLVEEVRKYLEAALKKA